MTAFLSGQETIKGDRWDDIWVKRLPGDYREGSLVSRSEYCVSLDCRHCVFGVPLRCCRDLGKKKKKNLKAEHRGVDGVSGRKSKSRLTATFLAE